MYHIQNTQPVAKMPAARLGIGLIVACNFVATSTPCILKKKTFWVTFLLYAVFQVHEQ